MRTDFKEYLEKKKAQKAIDKIAKKYADKKVVLYGAGFFANDLLKNYDLSKLNIVAVADMKFQDNPEGDYYGYKKVGPYDLLEMDFDLLLITTYDDEPVKEFLSDDLLEGEEVNFKVKTLIKMSLWDYIKQILAS
jgi:hypothetical protein